MPTSIQCADGGRVGPRACEVARRRLRNSSSQTSTARAAVAEDERELVGDETPVERDDDRADLGDREEALDELDAVHEQERDAVARADAEGREARWRCGSMRAFTLGKREPALALDLDERRPCAGLSAARFVEQEPDVVAHGG